MLGIIAVTAGVGLLIWYFLIRPHSYWTKLGVKQSKPWFIFGDIWLLLFKRLTVNDYAQKIYNMYPEERYSGVYNFGKPMLIVKDPELIKQMTIKDFDHFTDHPPLVDPDIDRLWSNNLFALQGERWRKMRQTLSPAFTTSKVKSIYVLMIEIAENFVQHFLEQDEDIIELEMKETYARFTNDVIATTAFGVQVNSLKDKNNMFYEMGKKLTTFKGILFFLKIICSQAFPKLFKLIGVPFLNKEASTYFYGVIHDTIKQREQNNIVRPDMINLLLEARKENVPADGSSGIIDTGKSKEAIKISDDEITSQAMIFFFAGFETVSTVMSFATYELAVNKDIQSRLREEIMKTQEDGKVTYEDLMQMKYMDMVISEVMRKWPAVAFFDRYCTKPYTIEPINNNEKPVPIKLKQMFWIPIYGIHRDPKYFPNPEKFDPERFSDKNKNNIVPYTYMPFGVGPRNCIGNRFALIEIKALLFNLLLSYEIVPTKRTSIPLVIAKDFSQLPKDGFWLGLKRIK